MRYILIIIKSEFQLSKTIYGCCKYSAKPQVIFKGASAEDAKLKVYKRSHSLTTIVLTSMSEKESEDTSMMWGYGFSWGGMLLMLLSMALWIALLVVLVWAVIRWLDRRTVPSAPTPTSTPSTGPSALEILNQRFARGEIDTATFEQMRERLTN
jgi:putative membrane protein